VTVHVTAEDRGNLARQVGGSYHVLSPAEHVTGGTDARSLHQLVNAEQSDVRRFTAEACRGDQPWKQLPHSLADKGESADGNADPTDGEPEGARLVEDVNTIVQRKERPRQRRPLVIAGKHEDRYARFRQLDERRHRPIDQGVRYPASEEQIAPVDDGIRAFGAGNFQDPMEGCEEIRSPMRISGAGPQRVIEAQVGVSQEEKVQTPAHGAGIVPSAV